MIDAIGAFLSMVWSFICAIPFFDTGISFGTFMLSFFSACMAVSLLVFIFGGHNSPGSGGKA